MKVRIPYSYDPKDPHGEEKAKEKAIGNYFLGIFLIFAAFGATIGYINSLIGYYNGIRTIYNVLLIFAIVFALAVLFFIVWHKGQNKAEKREAMIPWALFFLCGISELTAVVLIVLSVISLIRDNTGQKVLICAGIVIIVFPIIAKVFYSAYKKHLDRKKEEEILLVEDDFLEDFSALLEQEHNRILNEEKHPKYIFCRKCGKKIPTDSRYCTFCGTESVEIKD